MQDKDLEIRKNEFLDDEISLVDFIKIIIKYKKVVVLTTIIFTLLSIIIALSTKRIYESELTFISDNSDSGNKLTGLIDSPFASLAGISSKGSGVDYVVILKSRIFKENIIKKMNLEELYIKEKKIDITKLKEEDKITMQKLVKWLDKKVEVMKDSKTGVYTIKVEYYDPDIAANIANTYFNELDSYLKDKVFTKSKRTRKYLEKQIEAILAKLENQENELKSIEKKYKSPSVINETQAMGEMIGKLKSNIMELNAKLDVIKEFAGTENLEYKRTRKELEVYTEQLKELEKGNKKEDVNLIPLKDIPDIKIKLQRMQREFEATSSIYKVLIAQYEQAKLDELKDEALITVLDDAIPAEKPSKPNRKLIIGLGILTGIVIGIFLAFLKEYFKDILLINNTKV